MSVFSENLKRARNAAGYTQQHVADKFSVTRGAVAQWEAGITHPEVLKLPEIAVFLKTTVGDLFDEDAAKAPTKPMIGRFWMIYGIGQRPPACRHYTEDAAKTEALRLARSNPGTLFVVLEATSGFRSEQPSVAEFGVDTTTDDDIPF